jgi:uncharacterized membrane protein
MDIQWKNFPGGCSARLRHIYSGDVSTITLKKEPVAGKQWAIFWDENDPECYSILRNYRTDNPHCGSRKEAQFFAAYRFIDEYEPVDG